MDVKLIGKVGIYFFIIWLILRYPVEHLLDLYFVFVFMGFLVILLFVVPWEKIDKLEVKNADSF